MHVFHTVKNIACIRALSEIQLTQAKDKFYGVKIDVFRCSKHHEITALWIYLKRDAQIWRK